MDLLSGKFKFLTNTGQTWSYTMPNCSYNAVDRRDWSFGLLGWHDREPWCQILWPKSPPSKEEKKKVVNTTILHN